MSAQSPACQLLERYYGASAHLIAIAPPADAWLMAHSSTMISGDAALRQQWEVNDKLAISPFDTAGLMSGSSSVSAPLSTLFSTPFSSPISTSVYRQSGQVVLFWPKAHQLGVWWLRWLCHLLPENTPLDIVGEHQGGVKRVPKLLSEMGLRCDKLDNARRCSLFATRTVPMVKPDDAWKSFTALTLKLISHPGVFGHGKVDEGTSLLLETLESCLPQTPLKILDMGCGDGIISAWLANRGHEMTAVDVNAFAVEACRRTLRVNELSGNVLESDVYSALEDERFDAIISNPPFHQERDIAYGPSKQLIEGATNHLTAKGQLIIVANAFLPYPNLLERSFSRCETLADNRRFKVYRGQR